MLDYTYVTNANELPAIAREIEQAESIGFDLETTDFDPRLGQPRIMSVNTGQGVYVIDLFKTKTLGPIRDVLDNPDAQVGTGRPVVVGQNLKFDQKWMLHHFGVHLWPVFDTFRASNVIHNGRTHLKHDLDALYNRDLEAGEIIAPRAPAMGGAGWAGALTRHHLDYAAEDVTYLPLLRDKQRPRLIREGLATVALYEFQAIWAETEIELNGFALHKGRWLALAEKHAAKAKVLREELLDGLPHYKGQIALPGFGSTWNVDSSAQMLQSLRRLGIKLDDTQNITLAMVATEHPLVERVIEYRKYSKLVSSFGPDYLKHLHPVTGRIHPEYYPYTGAGRYACARPNLQQIPRMALYRHCFVAPEGWRLVGADYSQVELRLVAQLSQDPTLLAAYRDGVDVHKLTASIVLGIPIDQVTSAQRQLAKPVNFGLIYGLGSKKLVSYAQANYGVTMSLAEARRFVNRYFDAYYGVKSWQEDRFAHDKPRQVSRTIAGRRRFLYSGKAHNEFLNTPVQGSGADALKNSLWKVFHRTRKYGDDVRMVHMVHDEIILQVRDDDDLCTQVEEDLKEGMIEGIGGILRDVPAVVDPSSGKTWGDIH